MCDCVGVAVQIWNKILYIQNVNRKVPSTLEESSVLEQPVDPDLVLSEDNIL